MVSFGFGIVVWGLELVWHWLASDVVPMSAGFSLTTSAR
jgi:hypothetical protein